MHNYNLDGITCGLECCANFDAVCTKSAKLFFLFYLNSALPLDYKSIHFSRETRHASDSDILLTFRIVNKSQPPQMPHPSCTAREQRAKFSIWIRPLSSTTLLCKIELLSIYHWVVSIAHLHTANPIFSRSCNYRTQGGQSFKSHFYIWWALMCCDLLWWNQWDWINAKLLGVTCTVPQRGCNRRVWSFFEKTFY